MKAAFVHDHNFVYKKDSNLFYDGSGGAFDVNLWRRYLEVFDNLIVIGREIKSLPNKLVLSSADNVSFNLIEGANGILQFLKNKAKIKKELKSVIKDADFIIIRLPSTLGRLAFYLCKELNKKFVLEVVGDPFEAYWHHGNLIGKLVAPIEMIRMKKITSAANHVIYVTRDKLQKRYSCPNFTSGISNVRLESVIEEEIVLKHYSQTGEIFKIGLIGSFHVKYKGHLEAIKALRFLKDKGCSNIELRLVGTGKPDWVKLLSKQYDVEKQVKIIGAVGSGEGGVFPFLDELDLYIHPSKTEGLPRVVLEAMSRGRICLASNVGGTSELLDNEFIHEPGDWTKLGKQIEDVIKMSYETKLAVCKNNLSIAESYTEEVLQNKRVNFIKSALSYESDNNSN